MLDHDWDIPPSEAVAVQRRLADRVLAERLTGEVRTVMGADCAFADGGRRIIAAAVLLDAATAEEIARAVVTRPCRFPYVSGLLSFREAPAVIEAVESLRPRGDLLMCDGQGLAHPRGLGLASHVGLALDLPTIGVAKSRLCGRHRTPGPRRGCATQLRLDGRVIGKVVRTRHGVRPLFVSVGHRVSLSDAVRWTLRQARGVRLPEPTRQADRVVALAKRDLRR